MNIDKIQPILVVPAIPNNNLITFLHKSKKFEIEGDIVDTVWNVLSECNGYNNVNSICEKSKVERTTVVNIINDLVDLEFLVDSREQFLHFHRVSNSPAHYVMGLSREEINEHANSSRIETKKGKTFELNIDSKSALFELQSKRRSCRSFSNDKVSKFQIGNILSYGYSISRNAVPSGGCLYPLKLYLIVDRDQEDLPSGYYEYDAEKDILVRFNSEVDIRQLEYIFNCETTPYNSSVQIIIAADIFRQPHKYANLGYRLTLIEVGHVAQNISLACVNFGLDSVELGGILSDALVEELELDKERVFPILGIAVGNKSEEPYDDNIPLLEKLEKELVGNNLPIKRFGRLTSLEESSFFSAYALYGENEKDESSGGTANSETMASIKALVEGYERFQSSNIRFDYFGSANGIPGKWLNPNAIMPLTAKQISNNKLQSFDENLKIEWIIGRSQKNEDIFIPVDLVFYPIAKKLNRKMIYRTNSSGVAAFTDYTTAENNAVLELIERDCIMRNWLERKSATIISKDTLPIHLKKRSEFWNSRGRSVYVIDMSANGVICIQVVIVSDNYPCFVSGACAGISFEDVSNKALQEAELRLIYSINNPEARIDPKTISSPLDHGKLYNHSDFIDNISWLWNGEVKDYVPSQIQSFDCIKNMLNIVTVDLSDDSSPIKVVRSFSEKLIPINFGYGNDHYSHIEVKKLDFQQESQNLPHYFA